MTQPTPVAADGLALRIDDHVRRCGGRGELGQTGVVTKVALSPDPRYGVEFRDDTTGETASARFENVEHV